MWRIETFDEVRGKVLKGHVFEGSQAISFRSFYQSLQQDEARREAWSQYLKGLPFLGYRWETPKLTSDNADTQYEFVIVESPELLHRHNSSSFENNLSSASPGGVVSFPNLSGDAQMVVPVPITPDCDFGHLAVFQKNAGHDQIHRLWTEVGRVVLASIKAEPIWVNTAGAGVPWLHVRVDTRPKYYHYRPYTH